MALRLVFMGTPDFAVPTLVEIVGGGHEVVAVYTRAPQPAGRGMALKPSPVAREAERFGLPVFTPKTLKEADAARGDARARRRCRRGRRLRPDPAESRFSTPFRSAVSICTPRCCRAGAARRRSIAPIMAGDRETGVMVMKMDEGLDTGADRHGASACRSAPMRRPANCTTNWRGSAPS